MVKFLFQENCPKEKWNNDQTLFDRLTSCLNVRKACNFGRTFGEHRLNMPRRHDR